MLNKLLTTSSLVCLTTLIGLTGFAQETTPTTRPTRRPSASTPAATTSTSQKTTTTSTTTADVPDPTGTAATSTTTTTTGARTRRAEPSRAAAATARSSTTATTTTPAASVGTPRAAFDELVTGIEKADADAVMSVFWNSPKLVTFNNNGTVTKTWDQNLANRENLYANASDVALEVRDVNVQLLGRDGAVVMCLWKQAQTYRGKLESATGRLTVVFQRIGNTWKAVHTHSSPDRPDASLVLPSERTDSPSTLTDPLPRTEPSRTPAAPGRIQ